MSTSLLYHAFGVRGYRYVKNYFCQGPVGEPSLGKPMDLRSWNWQ
jgi:hypothetical protein